MKKLSRFMFLVCLMAMILTATSCASSGFGGLIEDSGFGGGGFGGGFKGDYDGGAMAPEIDSGIPDGEYGEVDVEETDPSGKNDDAVILPSGMITAGAWNDNDNYQAWLDLFAQGEENGKFNLYTNPTYSWGFNSLNRVKVTVKSGEDTVAGATVVAKDNDGKILFSAVSDAQGNAYLFPNANEGTVTVSCGGISETLSFSNENNEINFDVFGKSDKLNTIEIMLVVDVTGSMGDEIYFLKSELADVINRIAENNSGAIIKLAMLFYRDLDDKVPFDYYDFTNVNTESGMSSQQSALNKQGASGGGDYPEAVDEALELAVSKQWSTGATTKIIFHVLDAPAHEGKQYANKLVNATKIAAEKGIRICPIICSGAAESTEYTMREVAIHTGGTFIFVTDDSGIGGSHHDPDLPNVTVELLNSLMVRLVNGYHTGVFEDPIFWKEDPNLGTNK